MIHKPSALIGAGAAIAVRAAVPQLMLLKLRRDLRRLNAGDHRPLLSGYADDAVLGFPGGPSRWAGEHRGKVAIERFLRNFVGAGLKGELHGLWVGGPPWAPRLAVRVDDWATGPSGERLYANRVAMVLRTRRGKIVEHEDFFVDTGRIFAFEKKLLDLGVAPQ